MPRIAVLDDYQGVALQMADWSVLASDCRVQVFRDHLADLGALADRLQDFEVVTCMRERTPFRRDLLQRLPKLRLLVTTGMRNAAIDLEAATDLGILVCGTAGGPESPPAELTQCGATLVTKDELFVRADILTIHVQLSERTRGLVGARELSLMKRTAYLVNTARGPIVDETALVQALQARAIAGAGLDVFDEEPLPPDHPFKQLENTLLMPHAGYVTEEQYRVRYRDTVEDIAAYLRGAPLRVLNPKPRS